MCFVLLVSIDSILIINVVATPQILTIKKYKKN